MSGPSEMSLWAIATSVFVAGIVGSPHCLSMCGPLVVNFASKSSQIISYQLGRMLSYTLMGAALGAFGQSLLNSNRPAWLSSLALITIAFMLIFNGYRAIRGLPLHFTMPQQLQRIIARLWAIVPWKVLPKMFTASLAGFLTVLLPCGHLYGFLLGAAVTGSALNGSLFMFAFWLGSTPLLSLSGSILHRLLGNTQGRRRHRWAGALLIAGGLFSIVAFGFKIESLSRISQPSATASGSHHCHN